MSRRRGAAAAAALAVVLAGGAAAGGSWAALLEQRHDGARSTAEADARYLGARLVQATAAAAALSSVDPARIASRISNLQANGAKGVALTDGDARIIAEPIAIPGRGADDDLRSDPLIGPLLARAVDRGPQADGPIRVAGTPIIVAVASRFSVPGPLGASRRRLTAQGFVVLLYDVELAPSGLPEQVTGPSGRSARAGQGGPPGTLLRQQFDVGGRAWQVAYGTPRRPSPTLPLWLLLGAAGLAAAAAAVASRLQGRRDSAVAQAALRERQLALIEEAGAQLQQSLDLSELLPAVAVTLSEDFGFAYVDIALADDDGRLTGAFRLGERLDVPPAPTDGPVPVGRQLLLPLRRGWRVVGTVTARTERGLDTIERTALHALCDLLAVAVTNAQLLQREREAAVQLRELDAMKNAFLGTVSHELRTAMTAITGFSEVLTDNWARFDDDRRRDLAGRIRRNASGLKHLVDDLLDFARLEQQRVLVSPRRVDLAELVGQATETMGELLGDRRLDLRAPAPVTAWVDPFAVERILANLLSNAGKYTPIGTTVTVTVREADGSARMIVDDEGPGIPAGERKLVFSRFYRREDEVTLTTKGAGIGLTILADFVSSSGARVEVGEAPGGGARFLIDFPTGPVTETDGASGDDLAGAPAGGTS
ncbi:MAG: hypothetical protein JF603_04290 [Acidobacteria bacterium]|nr:hypothetical protein [Acidobacteriota bacterium]